MKITKYLHSCLLVEEKDTVVLLDPGIFTYQEKALNIATLSKLDYILITHEHPDHMHMPFISNILNKFPDVKIISNDSVVNLLHQQNITATTQGNEFIQIEEASHEVLWDKKPPQNILFKIFGKLTDPGDSHHFNTTTDILALPIQAPWGSTTAAVQLALTLKPKTIIPIHDWMWKDEIRTAMYTRLETFFETYHIQFLGLNTAETIEL